MSPYFLQHFCAARIKRGEPREQPLKANQFLLNNIVAVETQLTTPGKAAFVGDARVGLGIGVDTSDEADKAGGPVARAGR